MWLMCRRRWLFIMMFNFSQHNLDEKKKCFYCTHLLASKLFITFQKKLSNSKRISNYLLQTTFVNKWIIYYTSKIANIKLFITHKYIIYIII